MYSIDVPPPTISGSLHLGHVFSYCHMDFIARYRQRIWNDASPSGWREKVIYPFCFDCNGVPTEKLAHKEGISGTSDIIRFAEEKSKDYRDLFNKIQMSYEKDLSYHTYDKVAVHLTELSFHDLVKKGYAYKANSEYFWCPVTKVSVSQAEIDDDGCYERSGAKVETRTGEGWFINMKDHLPKIREAIDKIAWHPDIFRERLHRWLDDLKYDWSISRERKYGIPIPGEKDLVFDTWFTSSLSPQMAYSTLMKPDSLECPVFDVRFQAHDIIRTWALFTIVKSLYHNNQIPWEHIVISGHALDPKGRKISKSLGNFVPPQTYLDKYGASGVRYWAAQNAVGTDTKTAEDLMLKGKRLVNKVRNARHFFTLHPNDNSLYVGTPQWKAWLDASEAFHGSMLNYRWNDALTGLTNFFWHEFCDKYIEQAKSESLVPMFGTLNEMLRRITYYMEIFLPELQDGASQKVQA